MKNIFIVIFVLSSPFTAFAQLDKLQTMERELVYVHNTAKEMWLYWHNTNYNFADDYYMQYDEITGLILNQFDRMLNQILVEDRDMTYQFTELQNSGISGTKTIWSRDGLLRIFSWMLPSGTHHFYGNVIQYKNSKSIVRSFSFGNKYNGLNNVVHNVSYQYDTVYTLKDNDKTIYILSGVTSFSTRIVDYQLVAFSILDELVSENIFEDKNGELSNQISVGYDIVDSYDYLLVNDFYRPTIDEKKKVLRVPNVKNNSLTGREIQYLFNEGKFSH